MKYKTKAQNNDTNFILVTELFMVTAKNYVKLYTTIDLEAALSPQFIPSFTRKDKTNKRVTRNQFSWIIQIYD